MDVIRPKDRLDMIVKIFHIRSKNELSRVIGLQTPSSVFDVMSKDPDKFSNPMAERLLDAFPELNPDWVRTGRGDMLLDGAEPRNVHLEMRQSIRGGHHNQTSQYNFSLSGNEKIIKPGGEIQIEPTTSLSETQSVAKLKRELETLRRENAELKGELKAKNELISMLLPLAKNK